MHAFYVCVADSGQLAEKSIDLRLKNRHREDHPSHLIAPTDR
jgi:hypothetical protein